jgi:hypothetical protein
VLVGAPKPQLDVTNLAVCPTIIRKGRAMLSGTDEPECPQRQRRISAEIVRIVGCANATTPAALAILTSADDAPDRQATKALAHTTIHPAVDGAASAGCGAADRANSTALN